MFGSKHLLVAYCLGVCGIILVTSALGDALELPRLILFLVGLCLLWTSALFGPLCYLWEKGFPATSGAPEQGSQVGERA
jgi:hypothetical protein